MSSRSPMEEVLAAGGAMGRLIRSVDWSATPIGPIQSWPQSLRTAVSICLPCPFPLLIWWGPELVMLYNDAYRPLLGAAKHPQAMGARGADVWPEIWDVVGPILQGVLQRGEAAHVEDRCLLLDRHGGTEERYFTFSYSPIRGDAGEVCGVFTQVTEATQRVLDERRLRTLRQFAEDHQACSEPVAERIGTADEPERPSEPDHGERLETVQRSLPPTRLPDLEHVAVSARSLPRAFDVEAGGGWYDVVALPDREGVRGGAVLGKRTLLAVGEVKGRGAQAAPAREQLRSALRAYAFQGMGPARALERLNQHGGQHASTVLCLQFHARTGRLVYAAAGHPPPVLLRTDGSVEHLAGGQAPPIGAFPDTCYVEAEQRLAPGDTLLVFTNGLVSSGTGTVDEGLARLSGALASAPADLDALVDHVLVTVSPEARDDDLAVVALRVLDRPVFALRRRLESSLASLRGMRRELRAFLCSAGLGKDDVDELVLAISEAAANAIEHPVKATEPSIEVNVEVRDDEVVACVRDFGQWDDTDPEPDRGHGLTLIRGLVDIEVRRHVDGTRLTMRRALRR